MIEGYQFGQIKIAGQIYTSDVIIKAGEIISGWWRKEGHKCYWEDITPYLSSEIKCVILGTGAYGLMRPDSSLIAKLRERGIEIIIQPTKEAVKSFNERVSEVKSILAGFHLTC